MAWNHSSSTKQEIINANYNAFAKSYCGWEVVERNFTCNYGNLTTLVLYAEQGGFLIDDVEIFEKCNDYYLIQNKIYFPQLYNSLLNFGEKSGNELYAGKNIDLSKTFGDVVIMDQANIDYTATNSISLRDGFRAENGSTFRAIITPCPNYYRLSNSKETITFYDENSEDSPDNIDEDSKLFLISPNPSKGNFTLQTNDELEYPKQIIIRNILGQTIYEINNPSSFKHEINLSTENAGMYMITVYYNDNSISKRIIKE